MNSTCHTGNIILAAVGVVREFSIKGGSFELTSKLEKDMESVKTDVNESRDIYEAKRDLSALTQSMQSLQFLIQSTFRQSVNQTSVVDLSATQRELLNKKGEETLKTQYDLELLKTNRNDIVNNQTRVEKIDG